MVQELLGIVLIDLAGGKRLLDALQVCLLPNRRVELRVVALPAAR